MHKRFMINQKSFFRLLGLFLLAFISVFLVATDALAGGGAAEHHSTGPNKKFYFHLINFIILFSLIYFIARKPIRSFFSTRNQSIAKRVEQAQEKFGAIDQKAKEIEAKLNALESKESQIKDAAIQHAHAQAEKIKKDADDYAQKLALDARRVADNEIIRAKEALKEETAVQVRVLAEKLIDEVKTAEDDQRLISDYTEKLRAS